MHQLSYTYINKRYIKGKTRLQSIVKTSVSAEAGVAEGGLHLARPLQPVERVVVLVQRVLG